MACQSVSVIVTFAPHMTRSPIEILEAQPMTAPLNPQLFPMSRVAARSSVESIQGRLTPIRLDQRPERNSHRFPIRMRDPGSRRKRGIP